MNSTALNEKSADSPLIKNWTVKSCGVFRTNMEIDYGTREPVELDIKSFSNSAGFILDGSSFTMNRHTAFSGNYYLKSDGVTVAEARKPSIWSGEFIATYKGADFHLKPKGFIKQYFLIEYKNIEIGRISRNSHWNYGADVNLPASIDPEFGFFMIWLAISYWKNRDASVVVSGG